MSKGQFALIGTLGNGDPVFSIDDPPHLKAEILFLASSTRSSSLVQQTEVTLSHI
jgi:hypothetical protein